MGNFSRDTFNKLKNYVGVRLQQGVPLVDADWNEMEDIRKDELRTFIKWFIGDGVPLGNDGFRITTEPGPGTDFTIRAGICIVDGWETINSADLKYQGQPLFNNDALALKWGVAKTGPLSASVAKRDDMVYLDVWEREVNALEDNNLVDSRIGIETCVRTKREWVVRVLENSAALPAVPDGHVFYPLALLHRINNLVSVEDLRQTGLSLAALEKEVADARGMKANLGNRLDESLTKGGQLRQKVVGPEQLSDQLSLALFPASSYDFKNRAAAEVVFSEANANGAVQTINTGFKPRFIWAVGSCNTTLGGNFCGANSSGYADLRDPFIQKCNGACIYRTANAPFWRQTGYTTGVSENYLFYMYFSDESQATVYQGFLGVAVDTVSMTGATVKLTWQGPSTTTLTLKQLGKFKMSLSLLLLG